MDVQQDGGRTIKMTNFEGRVMDRDTRADSVLPPSFLPTTPIYYRKNCLPFMARKRLSGTVYEISELVTVACR